MYRTWTSSVFNLLVSCLCCRISTFCSSHNVHNLLFIFSDSTTETRMHSSRMRSSRLLPVSPGMHCSRGGVPGPGGCTWSWGGVPGLGVGLVYLVLGGVPGARGCILTLVDVTCDTISPFLSSLSTCRTRSATRFFIRAASCSTSISWLSLSSPLTTWTSSFFSCSFTLFSRLYLHNYNKNAFQ